MPLKSISVGKRAVAALTLYAFTLTTISPSLAWAAEREEAAAAAARVVDPQPAARVLDSVTATDLEAGNSKAEVASEAKPDVSYQKPDRDDLKNAIAGNGEQKPTVETQSQSSDVVTQALPTGGDKSGVTSQAISVPKGSGTIQGMGESFSAQLSTGIATFSVPFALPAARGGAQPSLGLSYSSASGAGLAGMGWSVGVPYIARQTDRGLPGYDDRSEWHANQDRFVFNGGQELVPICTVGQALECAGKLTGEEMPGWAAGSQYFRPRVEGSFLRFFWSTDHRTWRVQDKSGVTMELGVPLDGRGDTTALEVNPDASTQIFRWHLVRQYDTYGGANPASPSASPTPVNVVVYKYLQEGGQAYLSDIYDTTPAATPTSTEVAGFAHHTHLDYEDRTDPTQAYNSGWLIQQTKRLKRVDVTSQAYSSGSGGERRLVRRYHLTYDGLFHTSYLTGVEVEGRCFGNEVNSDLVEGADGLLGRTSCGRLPPMKFEYSHVRGFSTAATAVESGLPGYEAFDARIKQIGADPTHSIDEELTDYFDVNADGLPDVLVTAPGVYGNDFGVFFNSQGGGRDTFGAVAQLGVVGVLGANSGTIKLSNANVAPLDFDSDGSVDFLHMPKVKTYAAYRFTPPGPESTKWRLVGRAIEAANKQSPKVDLGQDAAETRVADVNFDGMVDVVVSTGTEFQTFLALGRLPGGDGQFGHGQWQTADTGAISNDPVRTCVPYSGTPVRFSDSDIQLADMNGDGIQDIVRLRRGDVRYWPGRGNGFWGTGKLDDCPAGTFGDKRYLTMDSAPFYSDIQGTSLRMDDVNGDGLDDLVQVRFDAVDVWLNVDGTGWTKRQILDGTTASPSFANRVRLMDINGSGTRDIVWGNGKKYEYIDLAGGERPGLLKRVENGLGKSTAIEYGTSTAEMLAAERTGVPCGGDSTPFESAWCSKMPTVAHVVKRVTESDNLSVAGSGASQYVTEYSYRDPIYEGRQREFRGFKRARSKRLGDANSPTDFTESTFLLGECEDETDDGVDACALEERWRDNPREALKGLPIITERFDDEGKYLSTEATTYRLRHLYRGLDGRAVRHAFQSGKRTRLYDTAAATAGTGTEALNLLENQLEAPTSATTDISSLTCSSVAADSLTSSRAFAVPVRAVAGSAVVASSARVDAVGNQLVAIANGCVAGSACPAADATVTNDVVGPDETLCSFTQPALVGATGWLYRTSLTWSEGTSDTVQRGKSTTTYTGEGAPQSTSVRVTGQVKLERGTSYAPRVPAPDPLPPEAVNDHDILVSTNVYDAFGNVTRQSGAGGRCRDIRYESALGQGASSRGYAQFPTQEITFVDGCSDSDPPPASALTTTADYDRALGQVIAVIDMSLQTSSVVYDEFGRLTELYRPWAGTGTPPATPLPAVKISYDLPTAGSNRAYSIIHTQTQDGATPADEEYLESYSFIDGMGRARVGLAEADPDSNEDGHDFIVSSIADFDAKGAVRRKYLPFFGDLGDIDPSQFPVLDAPPDTQYGRQRYDAFGRQVQTFDVDGTVTLQSRYHALSTDLWDAADLYPGPHQGSYASTQTDGHGRAIVATERVHVSGALETRSVRTKYLASGQPQILLRARHGSSDRVVRWMIYDSLGRMVVNADPHATVGFTETPSSPAGFKTWHYLYDDAGQLVGTSDARGCGQNFVYDKAGRLKAEDYSPCEATHGAYVAPDLTTGTGYEVFYEYDDTPSTIVAPPSDYFGSASLAPSKNLRGRLKAVHDRAATTWFKYDDRGRVVQNARRIAAYSNNTNVIGSRYLPRFYYKDFAFDAADRPVSESTGATQLLGVNGESVVTTEYTRRGTVKGVGSSYGPLVTKIARDAEGKVTETSFGDKAGTTTHNTYDTRRRLSSVQTYRGPPPVWSSTPAAYSPAPALGAEPPTTLQLLLEDLDYKYDVVNNPIEIRDWRVPEEWPAGAKPVTRRFEYDDLYRVTRTDYEYPGGSDTWTSPFEADLAGASDPRRPQPVARKVFTNRPLWQTFQYDWLGNTTKTDDDAHAYYDRSLGTIVNDSATGRPYRIKSSSAQGTSATNPYYGYTDSVLYDAAGNLTALRFAQSATNCGIAGGAPNRCWHRVAYKWDEVGRLSQAVRSDGETGPNLNFQYLYDYSDERIIREDGSVAPHLRQTLYIFDSLELRGAPLDTSATPNDYLLTAENEVPYLSAHGMRLGRVVKEPDSASASFKNEPQLSLGSGLPPSLHVFLQLPDHLGSTSLVVDYATSELVEARTYQPYGATESDYRPERWKGFREDYGFTGKEEDVELGLIYFGKRYLSPYLGRWISADPLTIHGLGGDLNLYAYVSGHVLKATDPVGLETDENGVRVGATTVHTVEVGSDGEVSYTFKESSTAAKTIAAPAAWAPPNLIAGTTFDEKGALDTAAPEREAQPLAPVPDGLEEGIVNALAQTATEPVLGLLRNLTDKPPGDYAPLRPFPNGDDVMGNLIVNGLTLGFSLANSSRLALNPKLLEYAGSRPSQALLTDVGQLSGKNCFNVALAVDRRLAGAATSALKGPAVSLDEGMAALREIYPEGSSMSFSSRGAMEKVLLSGGEGTRGVVFGAAHPEGHAFNAVVSNGRVSLMDGTIGGRPSLGGYSDFNVFFTQIGGGF